MLCYRYFVQELRVELTPLRLDLGHSSTTSPQLGLRPNNQVVILAGGILGLESSRVILPDVFQLPNSNQSPSQPAPITFEIYIIYCMERL